MCGIVGYTGANIELVKKAHALQKHRGPDGSGFFFNEHISLGHNRLAIIDLNERSAQPLWDNSKRYCVIFNGEIFNYQELRDQLSTEYSFVTQSDTEVLLALYIKHGQHMCHALRGMYAFAIYDTKTDDLFLARDHFGIKPLHYAQVNDRFYFASEIRAIASMFGSENIPLKIDHDSVQVYLTLGYTIAPHTLYKNINLLEPGTTLLLNAKKPDAIKKQSIPLPQLTETTEHEEEKLIEQKIVSSLVADVPVGVFFSGGTDSSLITAVLHQAGQDLETFSVKVSGRDADQRYFDTISKTLKLKSNIAYFDVGTFDQLYCEVIKKIDNPAGSTGFYQVLFVSKQAESKVKVVLVGDGGDELFLGYDRSFPLYQMRNRSLKRGQWLDLIYFALPRFYGKNKLFLKLFEWFGSPLSYYLNNMSLLRDAGTISAWKLCRRQLLERVNDSAELDRVFYLQDNLLLRNDAVTALCSLEGRMPLLDPDILVHVDKFARRSLQSKISKYNLKKILAKYLPNELVYRNKSGFGIDYKQLLTESKYLNIDLMTAIEDLQAHNIAVPSDRTIFEKYPHFALVVVNLWHAIKNNGRYHSEGMV